MVMPNGDVENRMSGGGAPLHIQRAKREANALCLLLPDTLISQIAAGEVILLHEDPPHRGEGCGVTGKEQAKLEGHAQDQSRIKHRDLAQETEWRRRELKRGQLAGFAGFSADS